MRVQVGNPTSEKDSVRREVFRREKQIKPTHTTLQLKKKSGFKRYMVSADLLHY